MTTSNQDIQSSHRIVSILERAKLESDALSDSLPCVSAVVERNGKILRGNSELATFFKLDPEQLLGRNLSQIFLKETWNLFALNLKGQPSLPAAPQRFELPIDAVGVDPKAFFWNVVPVHSIHPGLELYSVIGNDISDLRRAESQLSELFSSIPLGVLMVGQGGVIEGRHSAQAEWLLGTDKIVGQSIKEALFRHAWEAMSLSEREGVDGIAEMIGQSDIVSEITRQSIPAHTRITLPEGSLESERFLGVNAQPIVHDGIVKKLMFLLEDRTAIVRAHAANEQAKKLEEKGIQRILQLKASPARILALVLTDAAKQINVMEKACLTKNLPDLQRALHGLKGGARVVGLKTLSDLSHDFETWLSAVSQQSAAPEYWPEASIQTTAIRTEATEIQRLWDALFGIAEKKPSEGSNSKSIEEIVKLTARYNEVSAAPGPLALLNKERIILAMSAISQPTLDTMEELIRHQIMETSKALGKSADVCFDWSGISVSEAERSLLAENMIHLINNALAHGVESPEGRKAAGKTAQGKIWVKAVQSSNILKCQILDDGAGIDVVKVRDVAVRRNLLSLEQALAMSPVEAMQLIFHPGFSTSEGVNEISGRGVGLDAVRVSLQKQGGSVEVSTSDAGTCFVLSLPLSNRMSLRKSLYPWYSSIERIYEKLKLLGCEMPTETSLLSDLDRAGVLYGDLSKLELAVTTIVGHYNCRSPIRVLPPAVKEGRLEIYLEPAMSDQPPAPPANAREFELVMPLSLDILQQHGGGLECSADKYVLRLGTRLGREKIPTLHVALGEGVTPGNGDKTFEQLQAVCRLLDIPVERADTAAGQIGGATALTICANLDTNASATQPQLLLGSSQKEIETVVLAATASALGIGPAHSIS